MRLVPHWVYDENGDVSWGQSILQTSRCFEQMMEPSCRNLGF